MGLEVLGRIHSLNGYPYSCFHKLGVIFVGVLITASVLLGVYNRAPEFGKLRYCNDSNNEEDDNLYDSSDYSIFIQA